MSNVTLAAKSVIGYEQRHGFILATQQSRRQYGKEITKDEFINLKEEFNHFYSDSESDDDEND